MVRLFFFYLSGASFVLVGLTIWLVLHVILWFLEKEKFWGLFFYFSGIYYFNSALL